MGLIEKMLKYDYAVYWAPTGRKTQFGRPIFENPIEIGVRWEEGKTKRIDQSGEEEIFNGKVYVGIDLELDGMLWHGRLANLPTDDRPPNEPPEDAVIIDTFDKTGTLKNKKHVRIAYI